MRAFGAIAARNGGNRAAGTRGYDESARYVHEKLEAAGYDVRFNEFAYGAYVEQTERLRQVEPTPRDLEVDAIEYSPSTPGPGLVAKLVVAPLDSDDSHGCESADFARGSYADAIVLVKRGDCAFALKARNAARAGAAAVVIYGETDDYADWTLGGPDDASIPAVATAAEAGEALVSAARESDVTLSLVVRAATKGRSRNVIADLRRDRDAPVVMLGAHLDSVDEGPGLNDNASGSAALLEVAIQLARLEPTANVRFAFWGAEEIGLIGSRHYVSRLSRSEIDEILVYLNFDMVGSPNPVRFLYARRGRASERTAEAIERVFESYFDAVGLPAEPTSLGANSDHASFRRVGVATGGLFTGASEEKTARQARLYGGEAGEPYDACYHRACDTYRNIDFRVLHEIADAAAHALITFASRPSLLAG